MGALYEKRLQEDLERLRTSVQNIGSVVVEATDAAIQGMLNCDHDLCTAVILGDYIVNRRLRRLDDHCHAFIVRHLPSGAHLRFVSSVLRVSLELERVGDYAVTIAREAVQLSKVPPPTIARDVETLSEKAMEMLRDALTSFIEGDSELARATITMSRKVDHTFGKSLRDLLKPKALEPRPLKDLYAFQVVFNKLDRVGDQAENLCEETLFAVEGLRKLPRTFEIVFVDDRDDCATQMARALCEKLYPDRGRYHSAGWQPAESVNPLLNEIADELGLDLDDSEPEQLVVKRKKLRKFNVLVSLDGDPLEHIDNLPFLVTVVRWELHSPDLNGEPEHDRVALRSLYTELSARIGDLMEVLCGKECR